MIRGRMRAGGAPEDVCVRNVSNSGMMLQADTAPEAGTYVEVQLSDEIVVGRVMWSRDRRFGIRTRDRLPLWRLLGRKKPEPGPDTPAQRAAAGTAVVRRRSDARAWGRVFEFLCIALVAIGAAAAIALAGYASLRAITENITASL
jgi:PilZ domain-containing protein